MATQLKAAPLVSAADLVARAEAMIPQLRDADSEAEALGRAPDRFIAMFRVAGFFEILKPARYGGYELMPDVAFDVIRTLARGSISLGWVAALLIVHNWEIALSDPRVAEAVWGEDPDALISSSYAPFGKVEQVPGGYRVNGNWAWSSGCDHCTWVVLGANFPADNEFGIEQRVMILPRSDYEIDQESWKMAGMMGSGSKTIVVKDAFVPDWRIHNVMESFEGRNAGADTFTADTYKVSFGAAFAYTLATLCTGAAQGAIDMYLELMAKKRHAYSGAAMSRDIVAQQRLGEAVAMVNAAVAVAQRDLNDMVCQIGDTGGVSKASRIGYKNNAAFAARLACDAVTLVTKAAGGSAFALSQPLQRVFRDIHCGSNHAFINPEKGAANLGWFLVSGEINDFVI